jgi:2-hydroxychromene-2-carboxylate isomerase
MKGTPVSDASAGTPQVADFWYDAVCPWAWITSRWITEVEKVRPVMARWHVMCLSILNANNEKTERYQKLMEGSLATGRIAIAATEHSEAQGQDPSEALGRLYAEFGARFHEQQRPYEAATYEDALKAAGLPVELSGAALSTQHDDKLRDSHEDGMRRVGYKVGTPIISVDGSSFFGPVVSPIPRAEAAGRLWDGVLLVAGTDGFFELKRSRDRKPVFD